MFIPGAHQSCSIAHHLSWTGERKYNERLVGQDKGMKRSLTSYCHMQDKLALGRLNEFIINQIKVGKQEIKTKS